MRRGFSGRADQVSAEQLPDTGRGLLSLMKGKKIFCLFHLNCSIGDFYSAAPFLGLFLSLCQASLAKQESLGVADSCIK